MGSQGEDVGSYIANSGLGGVKSVKLEITLKIKKTKKIKIELILMQTPKSNYTHTIASNKSTSILHLI